MAETRSGNSKARKAIRTLLIEDIPSDALTITQLLTSGGWGSFTVTHVGSSKDALKALLQPDTFDVMLLDLTLADDAASSGLAQLKVAAPKVPVVVLTGWNNETMGQQAIGQGAEDYLPKNELAAAPLGRMLSNAVERHRIFWHLREVIARSADAMVVVDENKAIQLVNRAAMALFGGEAHVLLGRDMGFELRDGLVREISVPQKEGEPKNAEMRVVEIQWNGRPAHLVCLRDVTGVTRLARELKAANARLGELVETDTVASVLNRRGLERALSVELERVRRAGSHLAAVLLFCDDWRSLESQPEREALLVTVAGVVSKFTRPCDHAGRVTDDSFVVLLPETRLAEAMVVADKLRAALASEAVRVAGVSRPVRIGVGAALASSHSATLRDLFSLCRDSLRAGRSELGQLAWNATPLPQAPDQEKGIDIRRIVSPTPSGLRVVPHSIMRLLDEEPIGCEFLIRGPKGPLESPVALFSAAGSSQDTRALARLDLECLRACIEAARTYPADWRCHVNLFPATIDQTEPAEILDLFTQTGRAASFCVEISEQRFVGDPATLAQKLRAFRSAGIAIAIDDIGFGRSSLEVLLVTEPQVVKIDRRHIHGLDQDRELQRLVRRFLALIASSGAMAMAEGIERREDLAVLNDMGVIHGQGYLWGRPE